MKTFIILVAMAVTASFDEYYYDYSTPESLDNIFANYNSDKTRTLHVSNMLSLITFQFPFSV